jgi:hypothetical protein
MRASAFAVFLLATYCCGLQSDAEVRVGSCVRRPTWHPNNLGRYSPACEHVRESLGWLQKLRRSGNEAAFAASAWNWIDEASACIFAADQRLTTALDRIDLENLKARHRIVLRNALATDRLPLELPQEACAPHLVEGSKSNLKKIFSKVPGIQLHSKLRSKLFVYNASTIQGRFSTACFMHSLAAPVSLPPLRSVNERASRRRCCNCRMGQNKGRVFQQ